MPSSSRSHCPPHGPGKNVGSVRNGTACHVGQRPAERVAVEVAGCVGLREVEVAVDARQELLLVAVEQRPVDEEQPRLRAACARALARRSAPRRAAPPRARAAWARPRTRARRAGRAPRRGRTRPRRRRRAGSSPKRPASSPSAEPPEDRVGGRAAGAALDLVPRQQRVPDVDGAADGQRCQQAFPRKRRGAVDREHAARERRQAVLDGAAARRVARARVVAARHPSGTTT